MIAEKRKLFFFFLSTLVWYAAEALEALLASGSPHSSFCRLLLHQRQREHSCEERVSHPCKTAGLPPALLLCQCAEDPGCQDHGLALPQRSPF